MSALREQVSMYIMHYYMILLYIFQKVKSNLHIYKKKKKKKNKNKNTVNCKFMRQTNK